MINWISEFEQCFVDIQDLYEEHVDLCIPKAWNNARI